MTPAVRIQQVRNIDGTLTSIHTDVSIVTFIGTDVGRVRAVCVNKNLRFEAINIEELMFVEKELAKVQGSGKLDTNNTQKETKNVRK